jgi:hypothetical protein
VAEEVQEAAKPSPSLGRRRLHLAKTGGAAASASGVCAVSKSFIKRPSRVPVAVELVERPLPKPTDVAYVEARLLEAFGEARLALEYLERGLTRNAACKAFQAWKALLAAADVLLLAQELLRRVEALRGRVKWTEGLEKALEEVRGPWRVEDAGRVSGHCFVLSWWRNLCQKLNLTPI